MPSRFRLLPHYVLLAIFTLAFPFTSAAGSRTQIVVWSLSKSNGYVIQSSSLISDGQGNLFGVTQGGGSENCAGGCGVVFELSPNGNGGYNETIPHGFQGSNGDGANPYGGLLFDQQGNLYGTTSLGGANGTGTVYELSPISGGGWTETILYSFGTLSSGRASLWTVKTPD